MIVSPTSIEIKRWVFTNGMPMTSSLGCGIWVKKHLLMKTSLQAYVGIIHGYVSLLKKIGVAESELFGEFFNQEVKYE